MKVARPAGVTARTVSVLASDSATVANSTVPDRVSVAASMLVCRMVQFAPTAA